MGKQIKKTRKCNTPKTPTKKKLSRQTMTLLLVPSIMLLILVIGATYAYYNVQSGNTSSTHSLSTGVGEAGSVSLVNDTKNLHIRMTALNMQEDNGIDELWATDTSDNYDEEEVLRPIAHATVIGGDDETRYTCTFSLTINLTGTMVSSLQEGDAIIRFRGMDSFEYDLSNVTSPTTITINTLSGRNREESLYVSAKINNKDSNQDYLQGKSLNIEITNSDFSCEVKGTPSDHVYAVNFHPNRLPSAYQEVEYIKGDGQQYILTDVVPTNTTGVYLEMVNNDVTSNLVYFGSGYRYPTNQNGFWIGNLSSKFYSRWDTLYSSNQNNVLINDTTVSNDQKYIFELNYLNDRKIKRDGSVYVRNLSNLANKTTPISIYGYNNATAGGSEVNLPAKYQLYSFKISEGNRVIRDYIPCYRISDSKPGLYDILNDTFLTNASGSQTDFSVGNDVYYDQLISVDVSTPLYRNAYVNGNASFLGWNTNKNRTGTTYHDGQSVLNLTTENNTIDLYAMWPREFRVTYTNILGNYPTSVMEDEDLEVDFTGTLYTILKVYQDGTELSPVIDYTYNDMILRVPRVKGNIEIASTDRLCIEQGITNFAECLIVMDQNNTNVSQAKSAIATKTVDFNKIEPYIVYEENVQYGKQSNTYITRTTSEAIRFSTTKPTLNTETGYYTFATDSTVVGKISDYLSDENTTYYTALSSTESGGKSTIYVIYDYVKSGSYYNVTRADIYTQTATEDSVSKPGLYRAEDDYTTYSGNTPTNNFTYYYRGAVKNNWVYFGGFLWRVVRINGNGSIRMIYNGLASSSNHTNNNARTSTAAYVASGNQTATTTDVTGLTNDTITTTYKSGAYDPTYVGYMNNPAKTALTYPDYTLSTSQKLNTFPVFSTITEGTNYYFFNDFNPTRDCFNGANGTQGACTLKCGESGVDCVQSTWYNMASNNYDTTAPGFYSNSSTYMYKYTSNYKYTCWGDGTAVTHQNSNNTTSVYITCPVVSEIQGINYVRKTSSINRTQARVRYSGMFTAVTDQNNKSSEAVKNISDSPIKASIDTWYSSNIIGKYDKKDNELEVGEQKHLLETYLADAVFCNDRSSTTTNYPLSTSGSVYAYGPYTRNYTNKSPSFKCPNINNDGFTLKTSGASSSVTPGGIGNNMLNYPVGLITLDEAIYAGEKVGSINKELYLYSGGSYWTMSPYYNHYSKITAYNWIVSTTGNLGNSTASTNNGVRPVINLKSSVEYVSGTGTESDPYIITISNS